MRSRFLCYTFRTFPYISALKDQGINPFIFGTLKKDLEQFKSLILDNRPELIVGLAKKHKGETTIETTATNRFNRNGKISSNGKDQYSLFVPAFWPFPKSTRPSTSFCNWTMYSISKYLDESASTTRLLFAHIKESEIEPLVQKILDPDL